MGNETNKALDGVAFQPMPRVSQTVAQQVREAARSLPMIYEATPPILSEQWQAALRAETVRGMTLTLAQQAQAGAFKQQEAAQAIPAIPAPQANGTFVELERMRRLANEWREKCKEALDVAAAMGQRVTMAERHRDNWSASRDAMMAERDAALAEAALLRAALGDAEAQRDHAQAHAAGLGDYIDRLHDVIGTKLIDAAPKPAPKPDPVHNPFRSFGRDPRRMGNT